MLTRLSYLVGIFAALDIRYGEQLAGAWVSLENDGLAFDGGTPLAYMIAGGIPALRDGAAAARGMERSGSTARHALDESAIASAALAPPPTCPARVLAPLKRCANDSVDGDKGDGAGEMGIDPTIARASSAAGPMRSR